MNLMKMIIIKKNKLKHKTFIFEHLRTY
jgi:hypothetical protein